MTTGDGIERAFREGRIAERKVQIPSLFDGAGEAADQPKEQTFILPYPPSANSYWQSTIIGKGKKAFISVYISEAGKRFRIDVRERFRLQGGFTMKGPLEAFIELFPPDKRRRDWDNAPPLLMDELQRDEEANFPGAYLDDSQVMHADVWKRDPVRGGLVKITLRQI